MSKIGWPIGVSILFLSAGLGVSGCQPAAKPAAAPTVDPVAVVDEYMAGWNAHDAARAAKSFTDDVTYYDASVGTPQVGRDSAQKNVIQAFLTAVPDCVWSRDATPPVKDADGIAFQWTFSGTNTGPWGDGTKATKKKFTIHGVSLIRLRDGKIVYQGDYYDAYGFYKQLGLAQ